MNFPVDDRVTGVDGRSFNRHTQKMTKGDITMCLMRTVNGKQIVLKHDVCNPVPYDRGGHYIGSKGVFRGITFVERPEDAYTEGSPCRFGWIEKNDGDVEKFFEFEKAKRLREEYKHPYWKAAGAVAKKVGGHGGMDFVMDLRWAYCLQNGLPLDTDVYDLATYSSIVELSERSINAHSEAIDFPDYTRGGWRTAKPIADENMDVSKLNFNQIKSDPGAQKI